MVWGENQQKRRGRQAICAKVDTRESPEGCWEGPLGHPVCSLPGERTQPPGDSTPGSWPVSPLPRLWGSPWGLQLSLLP